MTFAVIYIIPIWFRDDDVSKKESHDTDFHSGGDCYDAEDGHYDSEDDHNAESVYDND